MHTCSGTPISLKKRESPEALPYLHFDSEICASRPKAKTDGPGTAGRKRPKPQLSQTVGPRAEGHTTACLHPRPAIRAEEHTITCLHPWPAIRAEDHAPAGPIKAKAVYHSAVEGWGAPGAEWRPGRRHPAAGPMPTGSAIVS